MPKKNEPADEAQAYVDRALETMRKHGAQPKVPIETYRETVMKVARAFDGLRISADSS